ncbi:murein biosynthesis integral membrane protein MurJ [Actinomadura graeca]|uniref:Murein biosynthesis integral membrane protein MurJ n=1 Tax=Actinomadura graeca TaxID=2750812 RepID=A0ABX8QZ88_9ACTN|nr:murein biosynthesis integral membrane protein MurJ [Actinomadura graeca]QXJ23032.1 murein biosynthesis integral membrane protein MurJ [Actinomadura graeca]
MTAVDLPPGDDPSGGASGSGGGSDSGGKGASGILRSGAIMAVGTLASRVTGFLRTAMLVAALGTGALADGYNTANTVPFIVYDLLLGGVLTAVVVPLIVRARERDAEYGARYEQRLFTLAVLGLAVITVAAVLLGPVFITIYGGAMEGAQRDLAVLFARLFAVQIFFLGVSAFSGAILNTRKRFGAPMWAPVLNNIVICGTAAAFLLVSTGTVTPGSITDAEVALLAGGTIGGMALQTIALWPSLRGSGFRWRPRLDFRKGELGQMGRMAVWTLSYVVITQIGFAVTTSLSNAAGVLGRKEHLGDVGYTPYFNAYQLFQLPYAIIGVSVITALLPRMSEHAAANRMHEVRDDFSSGLRLCSVIILPAAALMATLAGEITTVLFAHGQTTVSNAQVIANVLEMFAIALVPFAAYQLMLRVFYAMQDTRTPAFVSVAVVITNIAMAFTAYKVLPTDKIIVGIAGGFALAQTVGALVGWAILRRRLGGMDGRRIAVTYLKLAVALWPLLGFAYAVHAIVDAAMGEGLLPGLAVLVVGSAGGGILYLFFAKLLRVGEVQTMVTTITRRLPGR